MSESRRWVDYIVQALEELGGIATYNEIYKKVEELKLGETLTTHWQASVRERIESHSSDSANFKYPDRDYFFSVEGLGRGIWGLRSFVKQPPKANDIEEPVTPNRIAQTTYRILRETKKSTTVKLLYNYACQICNLHLALSNGTFYAEGHHIWPLGKGGPDTEENILCLCPTCHVKLDYGIIPIELHTININASHKISNHCVDYHNQHIYKPK